MVALTATGQVLDADEAAPLLGALRELDELEKRVRADKHRLVERLLELHDDGKPGVEVWSPYRRTVEDPEAFRAALLEAGFPPELVGGLFALNGTAYRELVMGVPEYAKARKLVRRVPLGRRVKR